MRYKEITQIPGQDPSMTVTIQKFTGGDRRRIEGRSVITKVVGTGAETYLDHGELKAAMMFHGIANAPFLPEGVDSMKKEQILDNLPQETYNHLWQEINLFNEFTPKQAQELKKTSDSSSKGESESGKQQS